MLLNTNPPKEGCLMVRLIYVRGCDSILVHHPGFIPNSSSGESCRPKQNPSTCLGMEENEQLKKHI